MPKPRKTITVESLRQKINSYLERESISQVEKGSLCVLLESILMETNNYKGFGYVGDPDDKNNQFSRVYYK